LASRKQKTAAQSIAEAEFIAANEVAKEIVWLRNFISEMGFSVSTPTTIYKDNQACIAIAKILNGILQSSTSKSNITIFAN
jgi:hypothetical protein